MNIQATMAGSIWQVNVKKGQEVTEGQEVVILESMKMEIPITSPKSGTIQEIRVAEGDFVNEGDVLAVIE